MLISIRSLAGSVEKYKDLFSKKLDYDKHYNIVREGIIPNPYNPEGPGQKFIVDELKEVEVETLTDLFDIFEGFREGMGYGGHFTVDIEENIVYVLDSWIE